MSNVRERLKDPAVIDRIMNLTTPQLKALIKRFPADEQESIADLLGELRTRTTRKKAEAKFMDFVKEVWPTFIGGRHHARMAAAFERVANGEIKRLIITCHPGIRSQSSRLTCSRLGFWANFRTKK